MPNGKPGDHPATDIVVYGHEVFTPEMDALIAEIDRSTSDYGAFDPFGNELHALMMNAQWDRSLWSELRERLLERVSELRRAT